MPDCSHEIEGGDFDRAGEASGRLKDALKRLGAAPEAVRRAVIAAYEAETNVVIHARRGALHAVITPDRVDVDVVDEGPGIPDVERAMEEGFSTASPAARALGFGAGMGLPNIRKNTDRMTLASLVGGGTRLHFTVFLKGLDAAADGHPAVKVDARRCTRCLRCLRACPTGALRIRPPARGTPALMGDPIILSHLCIDCAECVRACAFRALRLDAQHVLPPPDPNAVLALPFPFAPARHDHAALCARGWKEVVTPLPWRAALRRAARQCAQARKLPWPVIPPFCPAVVNLIRTRFHALIPHIAPFLSPIEAMRQSYADRPMTAVLCCPAEASALREMACAQPTALCSPAALAGFARPSALSPAPPQDRVGPQAVSGIGEVLDALDRAENGLLAQTSLLELHLCAGGCPGAPLLSLPADVASDPAPTEAAPGGVAAHRQSPLAPRAGIRLDADMAEAVRKLGRIEETARRLPGLDCGDCGAPSCLAAAEDLTLGRIPSLDCPYRGKERT